MEQDTLSPNSLGPELGGLFGLDEALDRYGWWNCRGYSWCLLSAA